jgi:formate hydrogenlyase transcriptional activator
VGRNPMTRKLLTDIDPLDLMNVVEMIPALVVCLSPDGSFEYVNRAWQEYTGCSLEQLAQSGWQNTIDPDGLGTFADEDGVAFSARRHLVETEARLRRADGQYRWFVVKKTVAVLRNRNGSPSLYTLVAFEDIDERKKAEMERERLRDRLQLLLNLTTRITSSLDLREVLRSIAASIREVIHSDAVGVALPDAASGKFRVVAMDFPHGKGGVKEELLVTPGAAYKKAMDSLKPVVIDRWEPDELGPEIYDIAAAEDVKAACVIPLVNRGRFLGILSILRTTETLFTTEDVDFLSEASGQIAIAVENALAYREISELVEERKRAEQALAIQNTRLQLLLELSKRITSNLELREVLRSVSVAAREIMHADAAGVAFFDEASAKSRIYAIDFPNAKGFVKEEIVVTPGLAFKRAWESSKPAVVNTNDREELGPEIYGIVIAEGLNGHCLIPLMSRGRTVGVLIVASKLRGSFTPEDVDFLSRASGQIAIAIENALAYREISELKDKLALEKLYLEDEIRSEMNFAQIIGNSASLRKVLKHVETVAATDSTVLIYGETGTGKELIARAIHDLSPRRSKAFVKLNCAAIPTGLLESELFGHEKGAFTGAVAQRIGRFEVANGGTIFLDEIGEIPLELQTKLLRVLQEREFERLGSSRTLRTDARLIAATNRDLEAMVGEQKFRPDLFFRLNVFPIHVPPLRERQSDIPLLVRHFAQQFAKRMSKAIDTIPSATIDALCRYHWPGNIRELQNVIERGVITSTGPILRVDVANLKISKPPLTEKSSSSGSSNGALRDVLKETERQQILKALKQSNWVVAGPNGAAAKLGMNRSTLQLRMNKLGISRYPV